MPPIITLQFDSFNYSSLHNSLNTLHNVLDLTIHYYTSPHPAIQHITSALPQITKRDRTLPKLHNTLHYFTSPLHYHNLRKYSTLPRLTLLYHCFALLHRTPPNRCITPLYSTLFYHCFTSLHRTPPNHCFTQCYTLLCLTTRHPTLPYHCLTAPQLTLHCLY